MSNPRWYCENGNIYFADIGREGSLVWVTDDANHTDEYCDDTLEVLVNPPAWMSKLTEGIDFTSTYAEAKKTAVYSRLPTKE